jgi:copper chaperone NosL
MKKTNQILTLFASLALTATLLLPFWKIDLWAPQYPEGLGLTIWTNKLAGDVEIINGLNHYIGMRTLHADDFWEFKVLNYIIIGLALLGTVTALIKNKFMFYGFYALFMIFAVLALYDFWRWEYEYGHNLDPTAAIQVPGMAYQPPLIGYKQLLNFGAYSMPGAGGWIFIGSGVVLTWVLFTELRKKK